MIGSDVEVRVVDIRGDKVRLGINAPSDVSVHRREVFDAIKEENQSASQISPTDLPMIENPKPQSTQAAIKQQPIKLAVLISGGGTTLQNILDRISTHKLSATVPLVIASKSGASGIAKAEKAGVPVQVVERKSFESVDAFSQKIFSEIETSGADLVVLGGWLQLLKIPDQWIGKVMNIHPALLPSFGGKGMYGHHVHQAVIDHGCKLSGCTVHFVDNEYDAGPIIMQRACPVMSSDTPESLAARVFVEEKIAYPQVIDLYRQGKIRLNGRKVEVG